MKHGREDTLRGKSKGTNRNERQKTGKDELHELNIRDDMSGEGNTGIERMHCSGSGDD
jgi:hypothetical protein